MLDVRCPASGGPGNPGCGSGGPGGGSGGPGGEHQAEQRTSNIEDSFLNSEQRSQPSLIIRSFYGLELELRFQAERNQGKTNEITENEGLTRS